MKYQILQNKENELLLIIEVQDCDPDGPMLICDGSDTALLFRDWDSNIRLKDLSQESAHKLMQADAILVIESNGEDIAREYYARIRKVKDVKSLML